MNHTPRPLSYTTFAHLCDIKTDRKDADFCRRYPIVFVEEVMGTEAYRRDLDDGLDEWAEAPSKRKDHKSKPRAECPDCGDMITFKVEPRMGSRVSCPFCRTELDVIDTDPLELDWAYDDPDDDDWDDDDVDD